METLAIVATKGGVGKTTLAVHLAVAAQSDGLRVALLDLDPQGSAKQWGRDRSKLAKDHGVWYKKPIDVRTVIPNELAEAIDQAEREGFDFVIIDTPPHADFAAARAVEVADVVLVPTRPGYFDLHAAKSTIRIIQDLKANAFFVVNQVPHNNLRLAEDAAAYLESKGLQRAPFLITYLQPYVRALRDGLTAPELVPDGRHAQEIGGLWAFLRDQCTAANQHKQQQPQRHTPIREAPMTPRPSALLEDPFADLLKTLPGDAA